MKRVCFLLFMCLWFCNTKADSSINDAVIKNITITMGTSITVVPMTDADLNSSIMMYPSAPTISDPEAILVVEETTTIDATFNYRYSTLTLTPTKMGVYSLSQILSWKYYGSPFTNHRTITYNITVVDVTAISMPQNLSMYVGEETTLNPTIVQAGAETTLTWQSSNTSVATVSSEGIVSALSIGTTTITCTAHNGVSAQCEVTVNPVLVSGIALNETDAELTVGEKLQLEATITPENATDKSVTWSSTNEAVAVVDESGLVTAVGSGTCQIKATANDGSGKTASCLVTVEKNNKLTVTDMTQCCGGRGVLSVLLTDEETIMGFQFDLELPTGVTVAEKEGLLMAALTGNAVNTHSISSSKVGERLYRFVVTPQGSRAISNADGGGMNITIDVADDMAVGTYTMTIKDIEMTVKKAGNVYEDIHPKNSTATLTITEATMGDVNGDGRVSVTDVISMNSYILEEEPAQFIRKVADLNGDGKVTITDMVKVIDIILGR